MKGRQGNGSVSCKIETRVVDQEVIDNVVKKVEVVDLVQDPAQETLDLVRELRLRKAIQSEEERVFHQEALAP